MAIVASRFQSDSTATVARAAAARSSHTDPEVTFARTKRNAPVRVSTSAQLITCCFCSVAAEAPLLMDG
ncbi:hypothetical protein D3C87_1823180 [compost metagenome]